MFRNPGGAYARADLDMPPYSPSRRYGCVALAVSHAVTVAIVGVLCEGTVTTVREEIHIVTGGTKDHIGPDQEVEKGDQGESNQDQEVEKGDQGESDQDQEVDQNLEVEREEREAGQDHKVENQGAEKGDVNQEANLDQEAEEGDQEVEKESDQNHQTDQELVERK